MALLAGWRHALLRQSRWIGLVLIALIPLCIAASGLFPRWHGLAPVVIALALGVLALAAWVNWQRERVIREHPLPQFLKRKLRATYPHLGQKEAELVERGLRQFFLGCHRSKRRFVAMPSRAADAMWHEFILHTAAYRDWCTLALGRFLHHTPAEVLGPRADTNDGLRRAWFWACKDEAIDPRAPTRLPLLFALDAKLAIPNGFHYVADCRLAASGDKGNGSGAVHCGSAFAEGSTAGDADGFGGVEGADGGGDGGCGGGD